MKRLIAGVLAGLVLGVTGTAAAGQHYYWTEHGSDYTCEGITQGVTCNAGRYQIGVTKSFVYVQERATEEMFACRKRASFAACIEG